MSVSADTAAATEVVESTVTVRDHTFRLLTAGTGEPVLYVHGSGDLGGWLPAQARIAADYTVIRPDLPGFNHSQPRTSIRNVHDTAYALWDFVDSLGYDSIRIIGSSLGGWIAADMATIEPSRTSHLVLVDAAGLRPDGGFGVDMFVMSPAEILERTYFGTEQRERAKAYAAEREDDPDAFLLMLRNRAATAKLGWNPYMHDISLPERLHRISAKTLLVWGDHDELVPVAAGELYAAAIPNARLELITDCGHLPLLEQPEQFLSVALPFLAS
jgi:pimeloyl-ACP methyl ester carboxylesterase